MLRTTSSESFENGVSVIVNVGGLVNLVVSQVKIIYEKEREKKVGFFAKND